MKINVTLLTTVAMFSFGTLAFAATTDFSKVDANADGEITLLEGKTAQPEWNESSFKAFDADGNGTLSQTEYETAIANASGQPAADPDNTSNTTPVTTPLTTGPAVYIDKAGQTNILASKLIGMRVYAVDSDIELSKVYPAEARKDWDDIGEVNDVVLDWNGSIKAVVLGVGGFLGMGEKDVAIDMSSLRKVRESDTATDWFLVVNSTKEALKNAPTYARN